MPHFSKFESVALAQSYTVLHKNRDGQMDLWNPYVSSIERRGQETYNTGEWEMIFITSFQRCGTFFVCLTNENRKMKVHWQVAVLLVKPAEILLVGCWYLLVNFSGTRNLHKLDNSAAEWSTIGSEISCMLTINRQLGLTNWRLLAISGDAAMIQMVGTGCDIKGFLALAHWASCTKILLARIADPLARHLKKFVLYIISYV